MKKMLLVLAAAILPFALGAEDTDLSEAANNLGNALNAFGEALGDTVKSGAEEAGESVKEGIGDAGSALKENAGNVGDSVQQGLESIGNALQQGADELGESFKDSADEIKDTAENTQLIKATGTLKKRLFSSTYTLVTDDATYTVDTISGSEDSLTKLSGYKNKRITVTGLLNTDTGRLTLTTYQLADTE